MLFLPLMVGLARTDISIKNNNYKNLLKMRTYVVLLLLLWLLLSQGLRIKNREQSLTRRNQNTFKLNNGSTLQVAHNRLQQDEEGN